jgi:hypothetical protein
MKRFALSLVAAACLTAVLPIAADSATAYKTTTTLEVKKATIAGKLTSSKAACLKNRTVIAAYMAPGVHAITEPTKSDSGGRWVIKFEIAPGSKGRLSAEVKPLSLAGGTVCKGAETEMEVLVR